MYLSVTMQLGLILDLLSCLIVQLSEMITDHYHAILRVALDAHGHRGLPL